MTQRKRVRLDTYSADLIASQDDHGNPRWVVGSCTSPPLGEADEMDNYAHFISIVAKVCKLLNFSRTHSLSTGERKFVDQHTYTRSV